MATRNKRESEFARLRQRAEKKIAERTVRAASMTNADLRRVVHELDVHQVELELQNEELRQTKLELEASYNELYDFAPVGYFSLDAKGVIGKTNLTGASLVGLPRGQVVGQSLAGFLSKDSRVLFRSFLARVFGGERKESSILTLMKGGQTPVTVYLEAAGVGTGTSCRAVAADITSAEQCKAELREAGEHLMMALDAAAIGMWEWDCDTGEIYCSPECFKILGIDSFCPTLDKVVHIIHPEDAPRVEAIARQALAKREEASVEVRVVRPSGEIALVFARGKVRCNLAGKPLRVIGIVRDITEPRSRPESPPPREPDRTTPSDIPLLFERNSTQARPFGNQGLPHARPRTLALDRPHRCAARRGNGFLKRTEHRCRLTQLNRPHTDPLRRSFASEIVKFRQRQACAGK